MTPRRQPLLAAALLIAFAGVLSAQQPSSRSIETMMGAALHQQEVEGNLPAAADIYRKVVGDARASRPVQAKALLELAKIAEKVAPADARTHYQRLTREFAEQAPQAGEATRRLARLNAATTRDGATRGSGAPSRRQLWTKYAPFGAPSRSGRYIAFVEFGPNGRGSLHVRDLNSGTVRQLVKADGAAPSSAPSYPGESRFSRDETTVAFAWKDGNGYQLRVVGLDGTGERTLTKNAEHLWLAPVGWSPDGNRILVKINLRGETGQIAWVTVASGAIQVLKSAPWTSLGRVALSEDGKHLAYDLATDATPLTRAIFVLAADGSRQVAATDGASRDEVTAWTPDGNALAYLSYRGGSPELWSIRVAGDGRPMAPALITRDMQGAQPLGFTKAGALIHTQIVSRGVAYVGRADWAAAAISDIRPVSTNVIADFGVEWSPDGKQIAYVAHRGTDAARRHIAIYSSADGSTREVVPAEDLTIATSAGKWTSDGKSYIVNGADAAHRSTYAVELATGRLRTLLTVPNGYAQAPYPMNGDKAILYHPSQQLTRSGRLAIRDLSTATDRELQYGFEGLIAILFQASPDEQSIALTPLVPNTPPSSLYVGPIAGGTPRLLAKGDPTDGLGPLAWTPDSRLIIYSRGGGRGSGPRVAPRGIWMVPAAGGEPRRMQIALPDGHDLGGLSVHPDGSQVAFTISGNDIQLWSMDNVVAPAVTARR